MRGWKALLIALTVLLAVTLTYSNHFHNAFQFNDYHSVRDNVFVRSLANVPRFFVDAKTSSVYPSNQSWRPLATSSMAIDYWLGNGYNTFYFHLSTFLWFLTLLMVLASLFQAILDKVEPDPWNFWIAWFAASWYGLHPAIAETVNYISQRADLMSTWGMVAGLAIYVRFPAWRRRGFYLVPVAIGLLCKPPALIFPGILAAYIFLFEEGPARESWGRVIWRSLPALVLSLLFLVLQLALTPKSFLSGSASAYRYLITQPYVWFRYLTSFFLPLHLSADTDLAPLQSIFSLEALGGFLFVAALLFAIYLAARNPSTRPVAFGLVWFALGLIPASLFPLAEVENDHRMFLPFAGLVLAVSWIGAAILKRHAGDRALRVAFVAGAVCLLLLCAAGTRRRNEVWHTEASLWEDVTLKSPKNGRGLMNYGLARMSAGDFHGSLGYFERASQYTPNYPILEINLAIDYAAMRRDAEAESHFQRAIQLAPGDAVGYYFYARWLRSQGRDGQAIGYLRTAIALNPAHMDARLLLLQTYAEQRAWTLLTPLAIETVALAPRDPAALRFAQMAPPAGTTPEGLLNMSLEAYQKHDFEGCIRLAQEALKLRPDYVEAYNNIVAANNSLGRWDDAIRAGHEALRIKGDFQLARNNLQWAESQKKLQSKR